MAENCVGIFSHSSRSRMGPRGRQTQAIGVRVSSSHSALGRFRGSRQYDSVFV